MDDIEVFKEYGVDPEGNDLPAGGGEPAPAPVDPAQAPAPAAQPAPGSTPAEDFLTFMAGNKQYQVPNSANLTFKADKEDVTKPISSILNGYRENRDYKIRMDGLTKREQQIAEMQQKYGDIDKLSQNELYSKWGELEKWSTENPDLFNHLWDSYQNRHKLDTEFKAGQTPATPGAPGQQPPAGTLPPEVVEIISGLRQQVADLNQFKTTYETSQEEAQQKQDEEFINTQVSEYQNFLNEQYPSPDGKGSLINLDARGDDGLTLRAKIMQHGLDKSIPDFEIAADSYLKSKLLEMAIDKGRTDAVNGIRTNTRKGIVPDGTTPLQPNGSQGPANVQGKSWGEISDSALQEYEQLASQDN